MSGFTLSRRQALLAGACVLVVVLGVARLLATPGPSSPARVTTPIPTGSVQAAPPPRVLVVDVEGAVRRPGVYRLASGARIADAITRAGGAARHADKSLVNLAAPLADGQQVLVPRVGVAGEGGGGAGSPPTTAGPVNLNTASVDELDALPGVGPVTAQKIVDYRREHGPFTSVDQLDAISGIGPTRIDNLRGHVVP